MEGPSTISELDTLRLSGSVLCQDGVDNECGQGSAFFYRWTEMKHDILSQPEVQNLMRTGTDAENLAVEVGALLAGETYAFQLTVSRTPFAEESREVDAESVSDAGIGSAIFFVEVSTGPVIINFEVDLLSSDDYFRFDGTQSDFEAEELTSVYRLSVSAYNPADIEVESQYQYRFGYFIDDSSIEYPLTSIQENPFVDGTTSCCAWDFVYAEAK